mmetsp:Transcript_25167/g.58454  ORF Transcript_25167/g.58454 Transcript_25167/m.58454 type:complete len:296 (-) Transcript_25167:2800-3687(-)
MVRSSTTCRAKWWCGTPSWTPTRRPLALAPFSTAAALSRATPRVPRASTASAQNWTSAGAAKRACVEAAPRVDTGRGRGESPKTPRATPPTKATTPSVTPRGTTNNSRASQGAMSHKTKTTRTATASNPKGCIVNHVPRARSAPWCPPTTARIMTCRSVAATATRARRGRKVTRVSPAASRAMCARAGKWWLTLVLAPPLYPPTLSTDITASALSTPPRTQGRGRAPPFTATTRGMTTWRARSADRARKAGRAHTAPASRQSRSQAACSVSASSRRPSTLVCSLYSASATRTGRT